MSNDLTQFFSGRTKRKREIEGARLAEGTAGGGNWHSKDMCLNGGDGSSRSQRVPVWVV